MGIYTRTGDAGETSLVGGDRVSKTDPRVEAYGTLDEANSALGLALVAVTNERQRAVLTFAQQRLYSCASCLATPAEYRSPDTPCVDDEDVAEIERAIDALEALTPPLRGFVLPGGSELAARLHVSRTIVRRAERRVLALDAKDARDVRIIRFLNRLSDLLFAAARATLAAEDLPELDWDPGAKPPGV